jgi:2-polyprenyl-3-methyl-5-hydroxy-6-metoxy-1,4-benzoquinol methylase
MSLSNPHSAAARLVTSAPSTLARILYKHTLGRLRYARGATYDAEAYWGDRFRRFGASLKGPGHEGLTEEDNRAMYEAAGARFAEYCESEGVSFAGRRVLEIGCGTGFYTDLVDRLGPPAAFTGLDVTDANFAAIAARHPQARLVKGNAADPGALPDGGQFDVVVMIDVIHHVVTDADFDAIMANVRRWLAPGGAFVITPFAERPSRPFFYVRWWTLTELGARFTGYRMGRPTPFRDNSMIAVHAPQTPR